MADISTYLQAILDAVYGEDVRGSIHDAIEIINDVGEKVLTIGTDVTSTSSSVTGYFDGSVYINNNTWDVWKCTGTAWALQGNIKGAKGDTGQTGATGQAATIAVGTVSSGETPAVTNSGTSSAAVFNFTLPKGDKGDTGNTGATGATPNISMSATVDSQSLSVPTVNITSGGTAEAPTFALAFSGLKGPQGVQGETGQTGQTGPSGADGVSPEVTVTSITGGHTVSITDADHPSGQSFNVMDGTDGVSPKVTIQTITGGHSVTITDEDHPSGQTFNVLDGNNSISIVGHSLVIT